MMYAIISGDDITEMETVVLVERVDGVEVIAPTLGDQQAYHDYFTNTGKSVQDFISNISYFNVNTGELTPDVESQLDKLRMVYAIRQQSENDGMSDFQLADNKRRQSIIKVAKRMRTGANER